MTHTHIDTQTQTHSHTHIDTQKEREREREREKERTSGRRGEGGGIRETMSKGSRYYLPTDEGWLDVDCDQYDFPCQLDLEFSKFLTDTEIQTVANSVLPDASLFLRVCLFDSLAALCRSVIVFYQLHGIVL